MATESSSQRSHRQVLADRSNDVFDLSSSPTRPGGKRRVDGYEVANKRVKLSEKEESYGGTEETGDGDGDVEMENTIPMDSHPRRRRQDVYGQLHALRTGNPVVRRLFTLPTIKILEAFVSSNKSDLYKCHSLDSGSFLTPPYACAYSHASKRGQASALAVATEQGTIDILKTTKRRDWDPEPSRTTLQVHNNGIFDIKWSPSDSLIATASGDRSIRITDPHSPAGTALHVLSGGHSSTVKCVAWDPSHNDLLVSGGRDGSICLWDLRESKRGGLNQDDDASGQKPVVTIPYAHETIAGKPAKRGRILLVPKSVTSVLYLPDSPNKIISGGSGDGILRKWDLRFNPPSPTKGSKKDTALIDDAAEDFTTTHFDAPCAGLVFSPRRRIFALSNDSRVHTYNARGAADIPLGVPQPSHAFAHRHMATNSFYVRAAVSPCGRWLASGGACGAAFLFDGVELKGQEGEVGALDWADGALATCADDGTVRVWRPDVERHRLCTENPEEARWDWSWGKL
ncbi:WD40 repeat-like protein [Phellopilus nigrolimitatus]|nr:WD40 repeat-like protein [Phellopilus nigrolimitatus]